MSCTIKDTHAHVHTIANLSESTGHPVVVSPLAPSGSKRTMDSQLVLVIRMDSFNFCLGIVYVRVCVRMMITPRQKLMALSQMDLAWRKGPYKCLNGTYVGPTGLLRDVLVRAYCRLNLVQTKGTMQHSFMSELAVLSEFVTRALRIEPWSLAKESGATLG
eukprot:4522513-Amphidinium_carterae.1